jgi:uncharacterized protein (TIGR02611 family)
VATADPAKPRIVQRLEAQRERHRRRSLVVRGLFIGLGFALVIGGLLLLVLPGPAFVIIPIGLALLSLEFAWAEGLLERALMQAEIARRKAAATSRTQRIVSAIAFVLGAGALLAWAIWGDIPLVPV